MPAPLSKEWIEQQLALCEKATPGPWEEYGTGVITYTHPSRDICELGEAWGSYVQRMDNAELIAATREGYPLVLQALLKRGPPMQVEWVLCSERMPTAGKKVWAWCTAEGGFPFWGHWNWQEPIWVNSAGNGPYPVSYWAEIQWPEPPKEG